MGVSIELKKYEFRNDTCCCSVKMYIECWCNRVSHEVQI